MTEGEKMIITYIEKGVPFDFKRIDKIKSVRVCGFAFKHGDILYYKKNQFEYFTVAAGDIIKVEAAQQ